MMWFSNTGRKNCSGIPQVTKEICLVVYLPLWKIWVSWDDEIPNMEKSKTCSKAPTRNVPWQHVSMSEPAQKLKNLWDSRSTPMKNNKKMVWFKFPKQHWKLDYSYPNKKKCFNVINHYFNANLIFLSFKRFCSPLLLGNDPREQSRRASLMLLAPPWVTKASQRRSAETWT